MKDGFRVSDSAALGDDHHWIKVKVRTTRARSGQLTDIPVMVNPDWLCSPLDDDSTGKPGATKESLSNAKHVPVLSSRQWPVNRNEDL
jgi:hypothetical protein